jgi:DMSO/TMAO reductase YedYZ heme-binding membrane subunit
MNARRSAGFVAGACAGAGAWALWACRGEADAYSRAVSLTRACGWCTLLALCAALCATPLAKLLRVCGMRDLAGLPGLRRALGIAAGGCGLLHASVALFAVPGTRETLWVAPQLRAGSAALLILTLLLATSFKPLLRSWKELHRLAYLAAAFAFLHVLLGPFAPLRIVLALAAFTLGFGLLRGLRTRAGITWSFAARRRARSRLTSSKNSSK